MTMREGRIKKWLDKHGYNVCKTTTNEIDDKTTELNDVFVVPCFSEEDGKKRHITKEEIGGNVTKIESIHHRNGKDKISFFDENGNVIHVINSCYSVMMVFESENEAINYYAKKRNF